MQKNANIIGCHLWKWSICKYVTDYFAVLTKEGFEQAHILMMVPLLCRPQSTGSRFTKFLLAVPKTSLHSMMKQKIRYKYIMHLSCELLFLTRILWFQSKKNFFEFQRLLDKATIGCFWPLGNKIIFFDRPKIATTSSHTTLVDTCYWAKSIKEMETNLSNMSLSFFLWVGGGGSDNFLYDA